MELTDTDINDLAAFFGRRLDPQLTPTPAPRTAAEERQRAMAWVLTLEDARDRGHLSALLLKIHRRFPDDANLQAATQLLLEPGRNSDRAAGLVFVAAGAAGVLVFGTAVLGGAIAALGLGLGEPQGQFSAVAVEPAMEIVGAVDDEDSERPHRFEIPASTGRCTAPDAGRVGWWYAGATPPGAAGSRMTMPFDVNVRVDFPGEHNGFDKRSHIACVLHENDVIRLGEPLLVPGNRYWVPLYTGDLLESADLEPTAANDHVSNNAG